MGKLTVALILCLMLAYTVADYAKFEELVEKQSKNETFVRLYTEHVKRWNISKPFTSAFPCSPIPSPKSTTSVHSLTPSNVNVVAAMGDSITAGTGVTAWTPIGLLIQNRGFSFSIGGVGGFEDHLTIVNTIKMYNPEVKGFATGNGNEKSRKAHLDVAVVGAKSRDMLSQAEKLIAKLKTESGVDFENDWKLITIFIGGNDLCDYCGDKDGLSAANYVDNIKQALDLLKENVPRAFVNVVPVLNITVVQLLNRNLFCDVLHLALCSCAAFPWNSAERKELQDVTIAYQEGIEDLVLSGAYDTDDDFTVVIQPFFTETPLPLLDNGKPDLSYFAPDCFHLSSRGHEAAATALWNNMFEAPSKKARKWFPGEGITCPTEENQIFYTYKNRGFTKDDYGTSVLDRKVPKSTQNTTSSTTTLIVAVAVSVFTVTAAAFIIYRKIHRNGKKDTLLGSEMRLSYTQI